MKCSDILSITFVESDTDREMQASFEAMVEKCRRNGTRLINKIVKVADDHSVDTIFGAIGANVDQLKRGTSVGLYLAAHFVKAKGDTAPPMASMAKIAAKYYEAGLRFQKINLNACFSAGQPGHAIEVGLKYEGNLVIDFCQNLVATLKDATFFASGQAMPLTVLDGCMVAGYRSQVVLYNPAHDFFKKPAQGTSDPYEWSKKLPNRVGNVFRESGGYYFAHPKNDKSFNEMLPVEKEKIYANTKIGNLLAGKKYTVRGHDAPYFSDQDYPDLTITEPRSGLPELKEVEVGDLFRNQNLAAYFKCILHYILTKKIVRFGNAGNISQISIADYSENGDIKEMVTTVTAFNAALEQLGVRVVL
ncbi:hypothetical protein LMG27952_07034 [Paraburkholderia hiiakae]|uniref:Uncharacterized protein n=1 Tax=Paraburkholderia hiiakae TaxID=1081782 RepID=A0ABM8P9P7_9BURK|nr:hypothetical protein [Paraburkholderia hiiakae]CAD6560083.1 hypothetical protein LMG27952_07034 [Paraburkholderia hiiakae]